MDCSSSILADDEPHKHTMSGDGAHTHNCSSGQCTGINFDPESGTIRHRHNVVKYGNCTNCSSDVQSDAATSVTHYHLECSNISTHNHDWGCEDINFGYGCSQQMSEPDLHDHGYKCFENSVEVECPELPLHRLIEVLSKPKPNAIKFY